jgi:hypothetical protein
MEGTFDEEEFDFNLEIKEFLDQNLVKSADFEHINKGMDAILKLETLDGILLRIDWSIQKGIRINEVLSKGN